MIKHPLEDLAESLALEIAECATPPVSVSARLAGDATKWALDMQRLIDQYDKATEGKKVAPKLILTPFGDVTAIPEAAPVQANEDNEERTIDDAAKILGIGKTKLIQWLRLQGLLTADNAPHKKFFDSGLFRKGKGNCYNRVIVTAKGMAFIKQRAGTAAPLNF